MRQDRTRPSRAFTGTLRATLLLLFGCAPLLAFATEVRCSRSASLDVPAEPLRIDMVDLVRSTGDGTGEAELARDIGPEEAYVAPDLSSRARSAAILREIFGEPSGDGGGDYALPARELTRLPDSPDGDRPPVTRHPAVGISDEDLPAPAAPADDSPAAADSELRLPGVSADEAQRYRREMYRTDI